MVGRGRIRTSEGLRRGVYSAVPLAAWIPARDWLRELELHQRFMVMSHARGLVTYSGHPASRVGGQPWS